MNNPVGRPLDVVAAAWALRFGLNERAQYRLLDSEMAQLSSCRSDEARRLILGISEQYGSGEGPLITDALMVR
jgi:hypothetical protein